MKYLDSACLQHAFETEWLEIATSLFLVITEVYYQRNWFETQQKSNKSRDLQMLH